MLCKKNPCVDVSGSVPVFLNVYDISAVNGYAYWFGLGVYHSGVQGTVLFHTSPCLIVETGRCRYQMCRLKLLSLY